MIQQQIIDILHKLTRASSTRIKNNLYAATYGEVYEALEVLQAQGIVESEMVCGFSSQYGDWDEDIYFLAEEE